MGEAIGTFFSWIWELFKIAVPLAGGVYLGLFFDGRRRRNQHLSDFAATVRAETFMLTELPDVLDENLIKHHSSSIARIDVFRNYMLLYDEKRWTKIEPAWKEYAMPGITRNLSVYRGQEIDQDRLIAQLNGLLHAVRKA